MAVARAALIVLPALLGVDALAQITLGTPEGQITLGARPGESPTPASPGSPFGRAHTRVRMEGLLARSDGETLSIELNDQRVVRFRLGNATRYFPDGHEGKLTSFHMTDYVEVDSEVDGRGMLDARVVRFVRKASPGEQAEIFQSPELTQQWRANVLLETDADPAADDRKLNLVAKPEALPDLTHIAAVSRHSNETSDELISLARRSVSEAFERLPNLRARQVTSMFKSASKPVKWIPDGVVSTEIAYEEGQESYGDLHVNGKQPADAPSNADADYMRSLDKAWSTGDFKTISHCIFSELADSDFHRGGAGEANGETLAVYEFSGSRSSGCVGVNFKSQITYPAYKGSMKVNARTGEVQHVELGATEIPEAFPLDRAERSVDFGWVQIGSAKYLVPTTAYWFGCFRNSYSCFMNRIDFRDYRRFEADSNVSFGN